MGSISKNTNINWITVPRRGEDEWCGYKKTFRLNKPVQTAIVRFESDCVCAVYVNGEFITSGTGRYPERVNCHEVTSLICVGENSLELVLGGHYFQKFGCEAKEKRGYWLSQAALELEIIFADGNRLSIPTNDSWQKNGSDEEFPVLQTMQVTRAEYDTMWKNAALWQETKSCTPRIPNEVLGVVGGEYEKYAKEKRAEVVPCGNIVSTDMCFQDGCLTPRGGADECYLIVDMERLVVGYAEFEYEAAGEVTAASMFDYTEQLGDFEPDSESAATVSRLSVTEKLAGGKGFYRNMRRRAFRYMKIIFKGELKSFLVKSIGVRLCIFPETTRGWFNCSDEVLNKAWEMGKYTLHVNKQQEYESCPRCEMLFFAGDGALDALIDIYAFGDCKMLDASLSVKHEETASGISTTRKFNRTVWQWDYLAWRIISIYNYYRHTGEKDFLMRYYNEAADNILWLTERMNDRDLLFQIPAFLSTFSSTLIQVDWACSVHRLGENAFLNCLLYKSLVCMSELANMMNDRARGKEWSLLANRVKNAINTYLWNKERQAYMDGFSEYICQDSNALAVIFGVADKERALSALETLKKSLWSPYGSAMADTELKNDVLRGGRSTISPMMSAYEAEAWFMQDRAEEGLELIRRVWGTMINKGATTFWEFAPNNADGRWEAPCHAWSAGCTYLLSAFVLGVRPVSANWKSIIFEPRPCDLERGKGVVPTPGGLIAVSWEKGKDDVCRFTLALPKDIEMSANLPENSKIEVITY